VLRSDQLFKVIDKEKKLYLPVSQRPAVMKRFHDGLAHLGFKSIADLNHRRYWWPSMIQTSRMSVESKA
jgi:hypothetical protein